MNEDKSTRYHRLKRRARLVSNGASAVLLLALVWSGGAVALRHQAGALVAWLGVPAWLDRWLVVALFALALTALRELVILGPSAYDDLIVERRFGLSNETVTEWGSRHLASTLGAAVVMAILAVGAYLALAEWPRHWWLVVGPAGPLLAVAAIRLSPLLPAASLHPVRPLRRQPLSARLARLARRAGRRPVAFYEWRLGQTTPRARAALVGFGRTRRVLISDTILDSYSDEEIEVVVAHELAHGDREHLRIGVGVDVASTTAACLGAQAAWLVSADAFGLARVDDVAGLPVLLLGFGAVTLALAPVSNLLSRRQEAIADRAAVEMTRNPAAFDSAMCRLAAQNLAEPRPSWLVEALCASHPPTHRRLLASRGRRLQRPTPSAVGHGGRWASLTEPRFASADPSRSAPD